MTTVQAEPSFRKALVLMTTTSFLVPAAGLVTAPILARALSADGRGQLAAALAPAGLSLAAATFGLPDALTFFVAKRPEITKRTLWFASIITMVLGVASVLIVLLALPFLRDGDVHLGQLILLAITLTIPALVIGCFRGAATGLQMWRAVANERWINTISRVVIFVALYAMGDLTVLAAVLVSVITPILSGVVYVPMLWREYDALEPAVIPPVLVHAGADAAEEPNPDLADPTDLVDEIVGDAGMRRVLSFGNKIWFGSVASMMLSRAAPILMAPLSDVYNLGLYTVATTISDLPLIVSLAIQHALYGVNSRSTDATQVTTTSRMTVLVGSIGCLILAAVVPFGIPVLFGDQFRGSIVPTLILMASAMLCIPGLMAATGLAAWGRPGLRSVGLSITLVVNVIAFVVLVPLYGVYGACWTSLISNVVMTSYMVYMCKRVLLVPAGDFFLVRKADVARGWDEITSMLTRNRRARARS